jgi:hypothetical protein
MESHLTNKLTTCYIDLINLFVIIPLVKELNTLKEQKNLYRSTQIQPLNPIISQINPVYVMYSRKINLHFPPIYV